MQPGRSPARGSEGHLLFAANRLPVAFAARTNSGHCVSLCRSWHDSGVWVQLQASQEPTSGAPIRGDLSQRNQYRISIEELLKEGQRMLLEIAAGQEGQSDFRAILFPPVARTRLALLPQSYRKKYHTQPARLVRKS